MSDKLPKVSIAVVGVVIAQIGGFIWWTAQQASTIANLEETVSVLTVENNATDRTNLIRDVEQNSENIDEMIDYIVELEEEGEKTASEVYDEIEQCLRKLLSLREKMACNARSIYVACRNKNRRKCWQNHCLT